jgi:hypothetical protein
MVLETEPIPFHAWFGGAAVYWLQVVGLVLLVGLVLAFFVALVRNGPARAVELMVSGIGEALRDLLRLSPRRVRALAGLAIKEAVHRRVLVAFAVFVLILLFGGWFLDRASDDPARLYLSFVLTTTSYLALLLALFISVFSLPADISNRTIYTVVTKPVRPSELVLGRLLGFAAVGTALLAISGLVSYFFVVRGLDHTHAILAQRVVAVSEEEGGGFRGQTELTNNHRHQFVLNAQGEGQTDTAQGHHHRIRRQGGRYVAGAPEGLLLARVPIRGKLTFKDRAGLPVARGVNVGEEWTYRSYIEGGTLAAAIWRFEGITPVNFPKELFSGGIPLELTIRVFRTHKGDVSKGILGALTFRNPKTGIASAAHTFVAKEFTTDVQSIPLQLSDPNGGSLDLFRDLAPEGQLDVELQCLQSGQYFGMAQPDVYIRARDASFARNFVKGYIGIWLQMLVLTAAGVMFSTFLNGAVAMLATLATLVAGFFIPFMTELATGKMLGGGPAEALYRIVTRMNVTVPLEAGLRTDVIKMVDQVFGFALRRVLALMPDFSALSDVNYVASGFDIPLDLLATHAMTSAAYLAPIFIAAYLFFRAREVAR